MRIIGIGIDIVDINRIAHFIQNAGIYGLQLVFSQGELQLGRKHASFYAGRFAAKEALLKAAQCGFLSGLGRLAEIETLADPSGAPVMKVHGKAKAHLESLGVREIKVSISHTRDLALATVILSP